MIKPRDDIEKANSVDVDLNFPLFFSDWIKLRRKQLDLTQAELAERACCSVFALRKIEAGERRPSKQLAGMLAKALEIREEDHATFIKVARGELGIEKLLVLDHTSIPLAAPETLKGNLPRLLTPFVGREPELTALAGLLRDPQCSLLTIVGPGGIGKTRLAIEAARQSSDLFPGGTWFIPLVSLNSPDLIVSAIADGLGFKFQDPTNLQEQLFRYLRLKKALLVLDNAEHLVAGAGVLGELLKECPQIKLVVTSQARLNLLSEWVFDIQGLPVPQNNQAKEITDFSSVALFLQCGRRVQADFMLRDEDRPWVIKICQIMEGMPLGIELSSAWISLLTCEEIAKEIEQSLDFLSVSMGDLPERHRSIRATLEHSWKLLNAEERLILCRLSVFRGAFSRQAAQAVCGASLANLSSLKHKSLLYRIDHSNYGLHEIIRQYAALKLAEQPDENEWIKDQHAKFFVQYLADCESDLQGSQQIETFEEMAKVIDNLSQGWRHFLTYYLADHKKNEPFPASLLHSALFSLSLFYEMRCRSLEAISILNESANFLRGKRAEFERTNDACEIRSLIGHVIAYLGLHHFYVVKYDQGREYLEEALTWLEDDLSKVVRAQVQVMLASAKDIFGELRESAALLEKSREVFREQDINWWYALSTSHLAASYLSLGRYDESEELFIEALRLIKPGDLRVSVTARSAYGVLLFIRNNFAKSEEILLENLQHAYRLGNNRQTAYNLSYLGRVALATNRVELAETYLQQALNILKEFGESQEVGMLYIHIGKCYYAKADHNAARDKFWQAIKIGQDLNKYHQVYYGLVNIARTYAKEGQTEKALEIFLLLMQSPVEYIRMKADYDLLRADLQAALPEGKMDSILAQMDGKISQETARADVLEYVKNHANG